MNPNRKAIMYTYEVSSKEPLHPDPKSEVRVLAHHSVYGCPK